MSMLGILEETGNMNKRGQAGKWVFLVFYMFFLIPCLYLISISPFPEAVLTSANTTLSPPSCTIGILALVDIIVCAINYVVFFFQFMSISVAEGYGLLWVMLFAPLTVIMGWVVAEFIRGTD